MTVPNDPYAAPDGGEHPQQRPTRPVPPHSSATPAAPPSYPSPAGPAPGHPGAGWHYPVRRTNGLAVASLVLGILWLGWVGSVLAVVFGHVALRQISNAPPHAPQEGRGIAIAGVVLGWVGVATLGLMMLFLVPVALAPVGL
ncbi:MULTISPECIES: DUF4190 domain-containing protein [unclassified Isoptericola]|uniref:DUF4190 domain-containing protein n=1 Tax=unclassified Isoptericola TaxID=2623355 RepID=UPI0027127E1E|nr:MULTISPECIES: DUF4190 domain-containing protein [unclassified Isoptericola]MDO8144492.1 DUF4190 domain-containing protein [Isoptericola sp. 178]MDO8148345.1 DUF4190 domain-containing protein [Isoptericola sp. b515]MDO8151826.1 DUF4190 domain-containing protein [Isoptericola sp. b408]